MHSYGGIPGSAACKGLSKAERKKQSLKGGIVGLVYIASFALDQGVSLGDFGVKDFGWYTDYVCCIRITLSSTLLFFL
jgi:hypothetical protein